MAEKFGLSVILKLIDQMTGPLNRIDSSMKRMGDRWRSHGETMRRTGRNMSMYVTLPLIGLGALAVNTQNSFESAFTGVRKTVNATEPEFKKLETGFINMSKSMPESAENLMKIGEMAGQLGIETPRILSFSKVIADLGATTNLVGEDAAKSLARFANVMQMPQDQFDRLGSTIVDLGNNLATTEAEIVEMAMRLSGAGRQVGMTEAQVMGLAAALSSVGLRAQLGGAGFSRIMMQMNKAIGLQTKELKWFAATAGMSATDFSNAFGKDAVGTILKFMEGLKGLRDEGKNLAVVFDKLGLDGVRTMDIMNRVSLAGDLLRNSMNRGTNAWKENIAMTREATLRYGTAASQFKIFWNEVRLVAKEFGAILAPMLLHLMDILRPMLEFLIRMPRPLKNMIVITAGITAAIGPLVLGFGLLAGSFAVMGIAAAPIIAVFLTIAAAIGIVTAAIIKLRESWYQIQGHIEDSPILKFIMSRGGLGKMWGMDLGSGFKEKPELMSSTLFKGAEQMKQSLGVTVPESFSVTDINLNITSDNPNVTAIVKDVTKRRGDAHLNVIAPGYLGQYQGAQ